MKIVSYNIHKGMDSNNKPTLKKMGNYLLSLECDIICLQEVLYHQYMELKKILKMEGVFAANVKNVTMLYGICIFSMKKITYSQHKLITSMKEQRGFIYANVFSDKRCINVINTHLGLNEDERKIQIDEILNYAYEIEDIVFCGDFNEKNISINRYSDAAIIEKKQNICTFPKSNSRIDYIFIDENICIQHYFVDKVEFSDHYPVIVKI
ncbi:MAG: endonuclease/exonuclease/phosphatase family protein [Peptostreptococcaceae bacterium]